MIAASILVSLLAFACRCGRRARPAARHAACRSADATSTTRRWWRMPATQACQVGSGTEPGQRPNGGSMIRKHTRRAAKAAFAVSFGVAIILGGADRRGDGRRRHDTGDADHRRHEELRRGSSSSASSTSRRSRRRGSRSRYKENIGSTELIQKALTSGQITLYPEYIGIALSVTFGRRPSPASAAATYAAREAALRGEGLHARPADAVPGRRRHRGAPLDGEPVQARGRSPT